MKVFISYSSKDRKHALELSARIRAAGHDAFIDLEELPCGRGYDKRIIKEIKSSHAFIFLASENSLDENSYAFAELKLAEKHRPNASFYMLPVRLSKSISIDDLPPYCKAVSILDAEGEWIPKVVDTAITNRRAKVTKVAIRMLMSFGLSVLILSTIFFGNIVGFVKDSAVALEQRQNRKDEKVVSRFETDSIAFVNNQILNIGSKYGLDYVITVIKIEDILITTEAPIGSEVWYAWQKDLSSWNKCDSRLVRDRVVALGLLRDLIEWQPTKYGILDVVRDLLEDGYHILPISYTSPDFRVSLFTDLRRNDLDFSKITSRSKKEKYPFVGDKLTRIALFEDGVIFGAGQNKGDLFLQYLEDSKFQSNPKAVVVLDDNQSSLDAFEEALNGTDISLYTIRYSGMDSKIASFNPEAAAKSLNVLREVVPILSLGLGPTSILGNRWGAILPPTCADESEN